jgi:hypothetical protein
MGERAPGNGAPNMLIAPVSQREAPAYRAHALRPSLAKKETVRMSLAIATRRWFQSILGFFEHTAAVVLGLILMVVGLGLGVTMVMLPVGIVIGLTGVAVLICGLFARIER